MISLMSPAGFAFFEYACCGSGNFDAYGFAKLLFAGNEHVGDFSFFTENRQVSDDFWRINIFSDDNKFRSCTFHGFGGFVGSFPDYA